MLGFTGACSDSGTDTTPPPAASVAVSIASSTIELGSSTTATAVVKDAAGNALGGQTVDWSTTNAAVATVDGSGHVTAVSIGSAVIKATVGGKQGSAPVFVIAQPAATLNIVLSLDTLLRNGLYRARAVAATRTGTPYTPGNVDWSTGDSTVATVNQFGEIRLRRSGMASVHARVDNVTATFTFTVPAIASVGIGGDLRVKVRDHAELRTTALAAGGTRIGLPTTWSLVDPTAGTINEAGQLFVTRAGPVAVRATVDNVSTVATVDAYDWTVSNAGGAVIAELPAHEDPWNGWLPTPLPRLQVSCTNGVLGARVQTFWNNGPVVPVYFYIDMWSDAATWVGGSHVMSHPGPNNAAVREFVNQFLTMTWMVFGYYDSSDGSGAEISFKTIGSANALSQVLGACP